MRLIKLSEIDEGGVENPLYVDVDNIEYIQEKFNMFFNGDRYVNYATVGLKSGASFNVTQDAKKIFSLIRDDKERAMQNKNEQKRF